jgi:hypothetical protein
MPAPFASQANFLDPQLTSDGRPYGPVRYEEIVEECYAISKRINTSYNDLKQITPLERTYLLQFIRKDLERENEIREQQQAKINSK